MAKLLRSALFAKTLCVLAVALLAQPLAHAVTTIKMGTLAPVGSSYYKILMTLGEAWKKDSGGAVELKLYAGGKAGGEAEMVGLMAENNLQAAVLTGVGVAEIDRSATGLQYLPMAFHNLEEVDYVGDKLRPALESKLEKKGFIALFWTDIGWVRFFTNKRVEKPEDLKSLRLFTWSGDTEQMEITKSAGFNAVPLETADIVPSLGTGLIDAVPMPPFYALASQVDRRAPYMLELNWAPLVGACVINSKTWLSLPENVRAKMLESARLAGKQSKAIGRKESDESVASMVKRGLKITKPSAEALAEWHKTAESVYPLIRGKIVPEEVFDQAMAALKEARAQGQK